MDMLGDEPALTISDEDWRIYSRHDSSAPQYIGSEAVIENSSVTEGCVIEGIVKNSVIGNGVKIGRGAVVCDSVVFDNVTISDRAIINYSIIASKASIGEDSVIGVEREVAEGLCVIGEGVEIKNSSLVGDNKIINGVWEVK